MKLTVPSIDVKNQEKSIFIVEVKFFFYYCQGSTFELKKISFETVILIYNSPFPAISTIPNNIPSCFAGICDTKI